jgi:protein PhnA
MAKGYQKHQARLDAISLLGKDLARRAGRNCELCEGGSDCRPFDTKPESPPSLDTLTLLCGRCRDLLDAPGSVPADHLRFVANHAWTDRAGLRHLVLTLLEPLSDDWARDAVENAKMMASSAH